MVRKDSLGSTVAPAAVKVERSRDLVKSNVDRHFDEWKACKGCPATHKQKELEDAESHLKIMQNSIPKIERTVQEAQEQHTEAQDELKRMEEYQEDVDAAGIKARINEGRHKAIKDKYSMFMKQHAQLAYEENTRCSKAWQNAMSDRAEARRIETEAKQKIEKILQERKQLEAYGVYVSALPAGSNGA